MILVDAGPLVALCDRHDADNATAQRQLASLQSESFLVCDAVLVEACFHLREAFERQLLRSLLDRLNAFAAPEEATADFRSEVFDWLVKYADHEPDWADACLTVLSGRHPHAEVWTYDREFRSTWRRPDGSAIPLVTE